MGGFPFLSFFAKDEASLRKSSVGAMDGCEGRDVRDLGLTFGEVSDRLVGCGTLPVLYCRELCMIGPTRTGW